AGELGAGKPEILIDDEQFAPEQMQQFRRLFRDHVDVAAELEAGVLDAGDDGERRGGGAADDAVGTILAAHELRGPHPYLLDRMVDGDGVERYLAGADRAQRIGKAVHRMTV